ncbi:MAG: hypothetical protein AB7F75_03365 [Planctomycetota bacterium]
MPKPAPVRWLLPALLLMSLALTVEILGPALKKPLWYDDLDGLFFGRLVLEGTGVDDTHPWPLDCRALDENGDNRVYQPGWIGLNALVVWLDIPHTAWRTFHVLALVASLTWLSWKRLTGLWMLGPLVAFIFADMPLRVGGTVRTYSLSAMGLTALALSWERYRKGRGFWLLALTLTGLWQLSLLALAYALFGMAASLALTCRLDWRAWLKHWPLALVVGLLGVVQSVLGWPSDSSWFTMVHDPSTRFLSQWHTLNAQGIALATLGLAMILLLSRRTPPDSIQGLCLGMVLASLLVFPLVFETHRGIWSIIILPLLWVESTKILSAHRSVGAAILLLTALTNGPAWCVSKTLPMPHANFIDKAVYSQDLLKLAPAASLHESRYHKRSVDEEDYDAIIGSLRPGDSVLYEFSRLSLMARLTWEKGVPVTGMFPQEHPYATKHPESRLVKIVRPCWVLLPIGVDPSTHQKHVTQDPTARVVSDRLIYLP